MKDIILSRRRKARIHIFLQLSLLIWIVWIVNVWCFHDTVRSDWSRGQHMKVTASDLALLDALPRHVEVLLPIDLQPDASGRVRWQVLFQAMRWIGELNRSAPDAVSPPVQVDVNREAERWEILRAARGLEADAVNKVHLFCGDRRLALELEDLAIIRYASPLEPEQVARIVVNRVREAIEAGLRQVVSDETTQIRISQGSGEPPLGASSGPNMARMVQDLEHRGARVVGQDLMNTAMIDSDADLLVVVAGGVGRFEPLGSSARRELERFMEAGGGVVILLPAIGECGLEEMLAGVGISVLPGLAAQVTAVPNLSIRPSFSVVGERLDPFHPITAPMAHSKFAARMTPSRVLEVVQPATALLSTGPSAWLERELSTARRDLHEIPGPQVLAACTEVGAGRLVVIGNWSTVLSAGWLGDSRRFFIACCDWAAGRDLLPAGAGREPLSFKIELDQRLRRSFFWTSIFVLPGCSLAGGLIVSWARRRGR